MKLPRSFRGALAVSAIFFFAVGWGVIKWPAVAVAAAAPCVESGTQGC